LKIVRPVSAQAAVQLPTLRGVTHFEQGLDGRDVREQVVP
jgi:hypothetical protein